MGAMRPICQYMTVATENRVVKQTYTAATSSSSPWQNEHYLYLPQIAFLPIDEVETWPA